MDGGGIYTSSSKIQLILYSTISSTQKEISLLRFMSPFPNSLMLHLAPSACLVLQYEDVNIPILTILTCFEFLSILIFKIHFKEH